MGERKTEPAEGNKMVKWYCDNGFVGGRITGEVEVSEDADDTDIDEAIKEAVMDRIEFGRLED